MSKIFSALKARKIAEMKARRRFLGLTGGLSVLDIAAIEWAHEEDWWHRMPEHMKAIFCLSAGMATISKAQMQSLENFSDEQRNNLRESVEILMIESASFLMKDVEGNQ